MEHFYGFKEQLKKCNNALLYNYAISRYPNWNYQPFHHLKLHPSYIAKHQPLFDLVDLNTATSIFVRNCTTILYLYLQSHKWNIVCYCFLKNDLVDFQFLCFANKFFVSFYRLRLVVQSIDKQPCSRLKSS